MRLPQLCDMMACLAASSRFLRKGCGNSMGLILGARRLLAILALFYSSISRI